VKKEMRKKRGEKREVKKERRKKRGKTRSRKERKKSRKGYSTPDALFNESKRTLVTTALVRKVRLG
jgi:hypothetical protein